MNRPVGAERADEVSRQPLDRSRPVDFQQPKGPLKQQDQQNKGKLTQFHAVKEAFDPGRLLNPDKAVPTLHRCAEFGAMHVHKGELKFPDIERF